jgi:hypothetical protein
VKYILHHQPNLLPLDETIESEAQRIASNLLQRNKEYSPSDKSITTAVFMIIIYLSNSYNNYMIKVR